MYEYHQRERVCRANSHCMDDSVSERSGGYVEEARREGLSLLSHFFRPLAIRSAHSKTARLYSNQPGCKHCEQEIQGKTEEATQQEHFWAKDGLLIYFGRILKR